MTSNRTRIAVTGGTGILATALRDYFPAADYLSRASVDVTNWTSVKQWFSTHTYDLILHLAAETRHDAQARALVNTNIVGTAHVVEFARRQGARLVYTSTDYCYPGTGRHVESDPVAPSGLYAWSKLGGESVVHSYGASCIVRGSWYSHLQYTRAATDAYTSKVPVAKAAFQIAQVAVSSATGIVNVGGPRRSLFEICATEFNPRVQPCLRSEVRLPYPLPADTSLDLTRFYRITGSA